MLTAGGSSPAHALATAALCCELVYSDRLNEAILQARAAINKGAPPPASAPGSK
jgi:hypothetical protein